MIPKENRRIAWMMSNIGLVSNMSFEKTMQLMAVVLAASITQDYVLFPSGTQYCLQSSFFLCPKPPNADVPLPKALATLCDK